jgi:hypothetical protein
MLRERDMPQKRSVIELIELVVEFGRRQERTVILEGIFAVKKYGPMLRQLASKFDEVYVYYLDIPFDEALRRHAAKPNAYEFGEKEMREWWNERDYLCMPSEKIFDEHMSQDDMVGAIIDDIRLS